MVQSRLLYEMTGNVASAREAIDANRRREVEVRVHCSGRPSSVFTWTISYSLKGYQYNQPVLFA
jgi:hypothetical protein